MQRAATFRKDWMFLIWFFLNLLLIWSLKIAFLLLLYRDTLCIKQKYLFLIPFGVQQPLYTDGKELLGHNCLYWNIIWHSLRLNAEVVARAWKFLGSLVVWVKIILQVVILFLMCLVRNLQKKWKKCPKSIQLWLCNKYCTEILLLGHVQLFDQFLEGWSI